MRDLTTDQIKRILDDARRWNKFHTTNDQREAYRYALQVGLEAVGYGVCAFEIADRDDLFTK